MYQFQSRPVSPKNGPTTHHNIIDIFPVISLRKYISQQKPFL